MEKVLVAMSGGVDSSVSAYMLKIQGYECCGCTMKLYDADDLYRDGYDSDSKTCCSIDDVADARSVANRLGISYYVLNYKEDFARCVIDDFIDCYEHGLTPNPCIRCNKYMKFDKLLKQANLLGYEKIATGHYAIIEKDGSTYRLKKAKDVSKDQSYVLYNLGQEQLSKILFPLGALTKEEVRKIAEEQNFVNAKKHDSQDICFVPDGDYAKMINRRTGKSFPEGDFVDRDGNVIGRHKGIIHYTIGQRRGLGISSSGRIYVTGIDAAENTVHLGNDEDLYGTRVNIRDLHWIGGGSIPNDFKCSAKIRYRMAEQPANVHYEGDGLAELVFDSPQRAATPGQTAVFYDGDYVLGGGTIY